MLAHYSHVIAELEHEPRRPLLESIQSARQAVALCKEAGLPYSMAAAMSKP